MKRTILAVEVEEPLSALERTPIEISQTRAKEIAHSHRNGPRRNVVMSKGNRWYDISHMTDAEIIRSVSAVRH